MDGIQAAVDLYLHKAKQAGAIFTQYNQFHTDNIVRQVAIAAFNNRVQFAKLAVAETGFGVWQDKVMKNVIASQLVYENIKNLKTVGVISDNVETGIFEIAQPVGPVIGVTPVTNPTSTVIFKILIALKTRNPIIICPHKDALRSCAAVVEVCMAAALEANAPADCIQFVAEPSFELLNVLMSHKDVGLVLATGGSALVKAAYSSGKPAIGVGAGNVPVLIERTADVAFAAENIVLSKTFDNGTICASEQIIIVEKSIAKQVKQAFEAKGGYFLSKDEIDAVAAIALNKATGNMDRAIVGQPASQVAHLSGISIPANTRVLLADLGGADLSSPLAREILAPILAYFEVDDFAQGLKASLDINYLGGLGHTAVIYTTDHQQAKRFGELINASRVLINMPSSHGAVGGIFSHLTPSFTLGCGSGGNNITSENVSAMNLINIKRCARRRENALFCRFNDSEYLDQEKDWDQVIKHYWHNYE